MSHQSVCAFEAGHAVAPPRDYQPHPRGPSREALLKDLHESRVIAADERQCESVRSYFRDRVNHVECLLWTVQEGTPK
jgi:hypothetical protein